MTTSLLTQLKGVYNSRETLTKQVATSQIIRQQLVSLRLRYYAEYTNTELDQDSVEKIAKLEAIFYAGPRSSWLMKDMLRLCVAVFIENASK